LPRLFVAVWPPDDLRAALAGLERPALPGLRWTTAEQWHVTLDFLGRVDPAEVGPLTAALASVPATLERAVEAQAGPSPVALSERVWALPVGGLEALAAAVAEAGRPWRTGAGEASRPFRGHLTLARAAGPGLLRGLRPQSLSARWRVAEATLVESRTDPGGAVYRVIAGWPLPA